MQAQREARNAPIVDAWVGDAPIVLERFPDAAPEAWQRLIRDVVGGGSAASALVAALDGAVTPLLDGVDVDAALAAADAPDPSVAEPDPDPVREDPVVVSGPLARQASSLGAAR